MSGPPGTVPHGESWDSLSSVVDVARIGLPGSSGRLINKRISEPKPQAFSLQTSSSSSGVKSFLMHIRNAFNINMSRYNCTVTTLSMSNPEEIF
ncbi:hypothetical protein CTI12_AA277660 [Artemisia annua]|uniref:Uncharacterized protein n=1 Tax=Artemisia annua TaxID=35608 RepID=A0A2U1NE08_ARTAN|nr:hypothetical protein CTI12_AA277660 [Artemisia annua]